MKKIVLSMALLASGLMANEIIVDKYSNQHDVGVKLLSTNLNGVGIGISDEIENNFCPLSIVVDGSMEYRNPRNQDGAIQMMVGVGVLTPSVHVWNNKVQAIVGVDQVVSFTGGGLTNYVSSYMSPKVGLVINDYLQVNYRIEQDENDAIKNSVVLSYKF